MIVLIIGGLVLLMAAPAPVAFPLAAGLCLALAIRVVKR